VGAFCILRKIKFVRHATAAVAIRLKYHTVTGPSPRPITCTFPSSSTVQTDVSLAVYFAHRVTSSVVRY